MKIKKEYIFRFLILFSIVFVVLSVRFLSLYLSNRGGIKIKGKVFSEIIESFTETSPSPTPTLPTPTVIPPTPTQIEYKITFIDSPTELMEGGQATFTWTIDGPAKTIHKSAVYFGTESTKGKLTKEASPAETNYTDSVKDFLQGDYLIPIRFVGNATITKAGKYFVRVYALIDNNNYWSDEREFTVTAVPGYEIKIINYPEKVILNENSAFTWEITGPATTTGFTAIVGAKESKSGKLDETVDLAKTPYKVLVPDFINGNYAVPLRYVGNTIMPEYGTYYIRALTVINGKNIWSDENNLSVQ